MATIVKNGKEYKVCPRCKGQGYKPRDWYPADGVCYNCGGRGYYDMNERRAKRNLEKLRDIANHFIHGFRADDKYRNSEDFALDNCKFLAAHTGKESIFGDRYWIEDSDNSRYFLGSYWTNKHGQKIIHAINLYEIPSDKFRDFVEAAKLYWGDESWYGYPEIN